MLSSISSGISRTPLPRARPAARAPLARVIDLTNHRSRLGLDVDPGLDPGLGRTEPELYITPELLAAIAGSAPRE